jgi:hypothetical protein
LGNADIHNLNKIYIFANDFCQLASIPFRFKEDSGNYETAIIINELGYFRRTKPSDDWEKIKTYPHNPRMFVPDLIDFENKIMIEFEEETGNKRPGAKLARKGHGHAGDLDGKRDSRRNEMYALSGFKLLRIWESELTISTVWKLIVIEFLLKCFREILEAKS